MNSDIRPILEIVLGVSMILLCMLIHSFGMYQVMHRFEKHWSRYLNERMEIRRQVYFFYLVTLILITHLTEILTIAIILRVIHAIQDFRTAFYFSGETYTSLGYGDILLPGGWRQLALFITMSGLLTFGWTTGVLTNIVGKTYEAQFSGLRRQQKPSADSKTTAEPE